MSRNLFLFTDGTGNAGGKRRNTNVYRLFLAIDRNEAAVPQRTFYDDGVGTADNSLAQAFGGAFGAGLSRNIRELYEWLLRNYDQAAAAGEEPDRIFVFGFSRGAFTARCLAALVSRCGILKLSVWNGLRASEQKERLRKIVWAYRATSDAKFEQWRGPADDFWRARIHFVGVWDTVDAVGVPIDELRPLFDGVFRLIFKRRAYGFDDMELAGVEHARHAIAIDDERRTFHPNVWHKNPSAKKKRASGDDPSRPTSPANIRQVWFAGAHSNVGGGYAKDQMAHVTLDWMMGELEHLEQLDGTCVRFHAGSRLQIQEEADALGRHYDPRTGPAVYYRYSPRRISRFYKGTDDFWVRRLLFRKPAALPGYGIEIHSSVFERVRAGAQGYAPLFLPDPEDSDFKLAAAFTQGGPFSQDAKGQKVAALPAMFTHTATQVRKAVHRRIALRQLSYAVFVLATVSSLTLGLTAEVEVFQTTPAAQKEILGVVTLGGLATFLKGLLPDLLAGLVDAAFAHPAITTFLVGLLVASGGFGALLKRRIQTTAQQIYEGALESERTSEPAG